MIAQILTIALAMQAGVPPPIPMPTPTPTATPTPSVPTVPLVPVCLTRTVTDSKGVQHPYPIIVSTLESAALVLKGFAVAPCATTRIRPATYRTEVCRLARGNTAVQLRLESMLGAKPKDLCASAQALGSALDAVITLVN